MNELNDVVKQLKDRHPSSRVDAFRAIANAHALGKLDYDQARLSYLVGLLDMTCYFQNRELPMKR